MAWKFNPLTGELYFDAGTDGAPGAPGAPGADGVTPHIGPNNNWFIGDTDTGILALGQNGAPGADGSPGADGLTTSVNGVTQVDGAITLTPDNFDDAATDHKFVSAGQISNFHAPGSDNQDLSGYSLTTHNHTGTYAPVLGADDNYVTNTEKANLHAPGSDNQSATDFDIKDLTDSTSLRATWSAKQNALSEGTDYLNKTHLDAAYAPIATYGYAPLGSGGKIASTYLDPIAITSTSVVASEVAQLALTAQEGDVAVRSDLKKTYIHNGGTAGTMADWTELQTPTDAVLSVDGQTGAVDLSSVYLGVGHTSTYNHANYDTAYGWGNHAGLYDTLGSAAAAQADAEGYTDAVVADYTPTASLGTGAFATIADYAPLVSPSFTTPTLGVATATRLGLGVAADPNRVFYSSVSLSSEAPLFERTSQTLTNEVLANTFFLTTTAADMVNEFGSTNAFQIKDNAGVANTIGTLGFVRNGADNTGDFIVKTYVAGVATERLRASAAGLITATGDLKVTGHRSAGTGTISANTVDNIAKVFTGYDSSAYTQIGFMSDITYSPSSTITANHYTIGGNYTVRWNSNIAGDGGIGSELRGFMGTAAVSATASGNLKTAIGSWGIVQHLGTGTLWNAYGVRGWIDNNAYTNHTGNINIAYNFYSECSTNKNTGVIATRYGMYIADKTGAGAVTNQYGLYIENIDGGATTNYSIYSAGGANYLAGNLQIGGHLNLYGNKKCTADTARTSSTALVSPTGMALNVEAGKTYGFEAVLMCTSGAGGMKFGTTGTATATSCQYHVQINDNTTNTVVISGNTSTWKAGYGITAITDGTAIIRGTIVVNAAGTIAPAFGQNASNAAATTCLAGSYIRVWEI